ncbi:Uncharacterized protein TCM_001956 [Theobroma cacao]|uniref:Reverse transcriptase domain-containing protein n=1 Tax=Theobroma cacao TaxID=3641 RepID=A0A061DL04_THECC|nr:Uncharacterized protein TCM_001956 [Theobroma cacao]
MEIRRQCWMLGAGEVNVFGGGEHNDKVRTSDVAKEWVQSMEEPYRIALLNPKEEGITNEDIQRCNVTIFREVEAMYDVGVQLGLVYKQDRQTMGTLESCDSSRALGLKDFSPSFFKRQWGTIKDEVMKLIDEFYKLVDMDDKINTSFITLVLKCNNPSSINEYRPIILVSSLYKIITKPLANRLKFSIKKVVSENQFTFIGGRQLLDCHLIANEVIDYLKKDGRGWLLFKVNFEKVYDSVEWDFLDVNLDKIGFDNSVLIKKVVNLGLCQGVEIGRNRMVVSHIQFTDDTINFQNSCLCDMSLDHEIIEGWAHHITVKVGKLPMVYLGLPFRSPADSLRVWQPIVDKFDAKLSTRKAKTLSLRDRFTLLRSVLSILSAFFMSMFSIFARVKNEIDKIQRCFLWEDTLDRRRLHYVNWDSTCFHRDEGGIGLIDLKLNPLRDSFNISCVTCERMIVAVGNEKKINFWMEKWIPRVLLKEIQLRKNVFDWELKQWRNSFAFFRRLTTLTNNKVEEFTMFPNEGLHPQRIDSGMRMASWVAPLPGSLKLNVDAVANGCPGEAGIGGVLRDEKASRWDASPNFVFESDSQNAVSWILNPQKAS